MEVRKTVNLMWSDLIVQEETSDRAGIPPKTRVFYRALWNISKCLIIWIDTFYVRWSKALFRYGQAAKS